MMLKKLIKNFVLRVRLARFKKKVTFSEKNDQVVTIYDHLAPEDDAMLQSLNSRQAGGLWVNLKKVLSEGSSKKFMSMFYIGYGHRSIGDCGTTTVSLDGISMLSAKAVQDWPLYSGQETSTRYIDVEGLGVYDPMKTENSSAIMKKWFDFYRDARPRLIEHLLEKFPIEKGQKESVYKKAIEARAFDILRSFLPAGAKTNASIHMNLRQFGDKLLWMRHHPAKETSSLALQMEEMLIKRYPSSFSEKRYPESEEFRKDFMQNHYLWTGGIQKKMGSFIHGIKNISEMEFMRSFGDLQKKRPPKTDPPKVWNEYGTFQFDFMIDFGSYRDLQRQRSAEQRMPLLTTELGFEKWYLEELPEDLQKEAEILIKDQTSDIESLACSDVERQYYIAMGFRVPCRFTIKLADLIYIVELRSQKTVHPTARMVAQKMGGVLKDAFPDLVLYLDEEPANFDVKRGTQDIVKKG
ncbi:FAD-dependent thymidylate synthase [Candidatus Nomurabacteria bacterium]|nr:FAD-dependent thymidylate synthase [Candidatus Nomurabacteria bacterium]USN94607.1 MAG: FAD-dependent thymidylate synthase [Candidatus Nomurabacteria bacterium]